LFPVAQVAQSLQLGTVDGEPFRAEVTLLPGTKTITWNGRQVPTRIHQYVAAGDVATLEVIWDRAGHAADPAVGRRVTAALGTLRRAADGEDLKAAAAAERALHTALGPRLP
jgi:hypothetical protein